ncbi:MAG: GNAT family N-acetyltransferase [Acholeplasmatales bacterium]|nr:GNAT family N-acetyltransferase [Acholeplasmatales bacterium]
MKINLPNIKLGSINLREINEADYMDYYLIGKDAITTKYLNWGPFKRPDEALWTIRNIFNQRPLDGLPIGYAICIRNEMIGIIDFHTLDKRTNTAEVGYILKREYWGQGIMKKCLRAIIDVGFRYLFYDKIVAGHTVNNIASKNVILACGFKYEYEKMVQMKNGYDLGLYYAYYKYEYFGGK